MDIGANSPQWSQCFFRQCLFLFCLFSASALVIITIMLDDNTLIENKLFCFLCSATVVQDLEKFWVGIQSKTLTPTHSESVNVTGKNKRKVCFSVFE